MGLREWIANTFYNDVGVLPVFFLYTLFAFLVLSVAIYFHELGHWFWFMLRKKKNVKIMFIFKKISNFYWQTGLESDYKNLTNEEKSRVFLVGILTGTLPILLSSLFWFPFLLLLIPYLYGSKHDLIILKKLAPKELRT